MRAVFLQSMRRNLFKFAFNSLEYLNMKVNRCVQIMLDTLIHFFAFWRAFFVSSQRNIFPDRLHLEFELLADGVEIKAAANKVRGDWSDAQSIREANVEIDEPFEEPADQAVNAEWKDDVERQHPGRCVEIAPTNAVNRIEQSKYVIYLLEQKIARQLQSVFATLQLSLPVNVVLFTLASLKQRKDLRLIYERKLMNVFENHHLRCAVVEGATSWPSSFWVRC